MAFDAARRMVRVLRDVSLRGMEVAADLALLRAHEPVIRYTHGELFLPTAVGPYVQRCSLWIHEPGTPPDSAELLVPPGELSLDALAALGRDRRDRSLELRFVEQRLRGAAMRAWRRADRPRLRGAARLASVGVLARTVDSFLRLSLLLRGRTPGGTAAAAEVAAREHLELQRRAYYGRVVRDGDYVVLQYWLFHVFNDWRSTFAGVNDHEADWELVAVYLTDQGEGLQPRWVAASCHDHAGDELRRRWDDPRLLREGDHPVIFAGAGSHAGGFEAGDVVVSVALPVLRRIVEGAARAWRRLAPWSRWSPPAGAFGLPFVDYLRGDGTVVGPGQAQAWEACVVSDATPWVRDYRGLWGLDTHDVFGGERAPAGPRYERGGAVRASWADPLGWAGLQKEPPSESAAAEDLRERVRALDARVEQLDQVIDVERTALRGTAAELRALEEHAGLQPHASVLRAEVRRAERDLAARYVERARLADAAAVNREHLDRPPRPLAPDAHRPSPAAADHRKRPRMLRVWGALSTPLLVGTIVVLLLGPPLAFLSSLVLFVVLFLGIEAAARARLLSFLVGVALTALTLALAVVLVTGLLQNWRVVLAALLGLVALVLLVVNVRELRR